MIKVYLKGTPLEVAANVRKNLSQNVDTPTWQDVANSFQQLTQHHFEFHEIEQTADSSPITHSRLFKERRVVFYQTESVTTSNLRCYKIASECYIAFRNPNKYSTQAQLSELIEWNHFNTHNVEIEHADVPEIQLEHHSNLCAIEILIPLETRLRYRQLVEKGEATYKMIADLHGIPEIELCRSVSRSYLQQCGVRFEDWNL